ncbi:stage III sporulation protein AG [Clostridium tetanomorphum]|uniref:Stage III sporulation protein AG n=1 Tax=Clostridium tetanomorphum TaxID=1553 RepID=A0A923E9W9_CLOTT|nr:stage III sporulation protein AG [Clostridium tetanomorphum]KAJ51482.1 stage III sporulation protein AG [Clostridium tetanomorphum DSM 665]MBC2396575.1 stage III sporulation protein AG [Clostridium tetanomorphum]MBP1863903.1 stage III sporulation protein AG [Clostridium tetanomorphum]NRS84981.1 stage III sporulation protein AG [Clostridium tetanomorphum]NRZ98197.1 stage III sporulation protein AG [Clostridium tetanomorphum]
MDLKKLLEKLKKNEGKKGLSNKTTINLLIVFLIGVLILITGSFFKTTGNSVKETVSKNNNNDQVEEPIKEPEEETEKELKNELKNILQQTDGVGRVEVMIYFASGEEQIPAVNINDSTNSTEEIDNEGGRRQTTQKNNGSTVVITNNGDKTQPLIVKKNKPKVTGVFIVAEGAENKVTEYRIKKAVINLFNIPDNKVNVYPMKK